MRARLRVRKRWGGRALGLTLLCSTMLAAASAGADQLFYETWEGYTSFPDVNGSGPLNRGLTLISEGSNEEWFGGRFDFPDPTKQTTIDEDLAVEEFGGGTNLSHVGRFENEAGLVFQVSTLGYTNVQLDFDWRTLSAFGTDRLIVGWIAADIPGLGFGVGESPYFDFRGSPWDWLDWTQILEGKSASWQQLSASLPGGLANIYVAFWIHNGEGDIGKIDNVMVTGTLPEPSSALLLGMGLLGFALVRRHRTR